MILKSKKKCNEEEKTLLLIKVIPGSSKSEIVGWEGNHLKCKLTSLPEKGKANKQLIQLLSKAFKIPKSKIRIVSGEASKAKKVEISGVVEKLKISSSRSKLERSHLGKDREERYALQRNFAK